MVRDIIIHPGENDLIVGTYGRGAWITDISPLQQFTAEVQGKDFFLFDIDPKPQMNFSQQAYWGNYQMTGSNHLRTANEPNGLEIWYYFANDDKTEAQITVNDDNGKELFKKSVPVKKGINKLFWDSENTAPGKYSVSLKLKEKTISKKGIVEERLTWPVLNYRE
jgi:hypothetical protein